MNDIKSTIRKVRELAAIPMKDDREIKRVEIIMLKFKEDPEIIDKAITRIIHNTDWPFKLTVFDNRPNSANTSRIWNKLVYESTCDYVLIIDSDAYIPATKLSPCWLTRMMESIEETGIVIPVSSAPGGAHQHVSGPEEYPSSVRNKDVWSGYCFLFYRERVWNPERFNEKFYIYGQDSEWAHRTSRKFGGAVMRKDVFVEHIGGASFKKDPMRDADKFYARELFKYLTKDK
jgi:hypothetical protein